MDRATQVGCVTVTSSTPVPGSCPSSTVVTLHGGHLPRLLTPLHLNHSGSSLPTSQDPSPIPRGSSGALAWSPKTGSVNLRLESDLYRSLAREPTGKGLQSALGEDRQGRNISLRVRSLKKTGEKQRPG